MWYFYKSTPSSANIHVLAMLSELENLQLEASASSLPTTYITKLIAFIISELCTL